MADREPDGADRPLTRNRAARGVGAVALAGTHVAMLAGLADHYGLRPEIVSGFAVGTFVGLMSLVVEIAVIGRSMRLFGHNGMGATLQTFTMRLAVVGLLGTLFMRAVTNVHYQAFCMAYVATFFVYLCWLTWRTATEPVQYAGGARAASTASTSAPTPPSSAPAASRAVARRPVGSAR